MIAFKEKIRQYIYDYLFGYHDNPISTPNLYYEFIKRLNDNQTLLDVGVGTGIYFCNKKCISLIKKKNIKIFGIDINKSDIDLAKKRIISHNLENYVSVENVDFLTLNLNRFDSILFCESYPVIEKSLMKKFLQHIYNNNKYANNIYFINNIEDDPSIIQKIKPYLKYFFMGNDLFGRLVNKHDMLSLLNDQFHLQNILFEVIGQSTINYLLFKNKIKIPGLNFNIKQFLVTVKK